MRRLLPLFVLLSLLLPLAAVGWLGLRLAEQQQSAVESQIQGLLEDRLNDLAVDINDHLASLERTLLRRLAAYPDDWRAAAAQLEHDPPAGENIFVLDPRSELAYPTDDLPQLSTQQRFLQRTRQIWGTETLGQSHGPDPQPPSAATRSRPVEDLAPKRDTRGPREPARMPSVAQEAEMADAEGLAIPTAPARRKAESPIERESGWHSWYLEDGLNLLLWQRLSYGGILGIEVDRITLLAELIGRLPASDGSLPEARIQLIDAQGRILYQWGEYQPPEEAQPDAQRPLDAPLASWRLHYHYDPARLADNRALGRLQLLVVLGGFGVLLIAIAIVLYREVDRGLREASQRVNFVNQVSHELKTPLTNIRMYAELLRDELTDQPGPWRKAEVIEGEAQRLSRLIANVLGYARQQRHALRIDPISMHLDDCVGEVVEQFRPSLARKCIAIELDLQAPAPIQADRDAIAQIIANLISNVEKYAANGKLLRITTRQTPEQTRLDVRDQGPGIPRRYRKRIFQPFFRIRGDLTEGVSGTGIGLGIARELARMHGGDLTLETNPQGALFRVILATLHEPPGNS